MPETKRRILLMTAKVLFETEKYAVEESGDERMIIAEDGKYGNRPGYVVVNKETGVVEHSTVMLPGAIFQCQHFNDTLISLLADPSEDIDIEALDVPEDIVPN